MQTQKANVGANVFSVFKSSCAGISLILILSTEQMVQQLSFTSKPVQYSNRNFKIKQIVNKVKCNLQLN